MNYRSKALILLSLLSGCAYSQSSIDELEERWLDRIDYCVDIARENKVSFPKSDWFLSLSVEDQKNVVGYIANFNDRECSKVETEAFLTAIREQKAQEAFDRNAVDLRPLEELASERMKNIDMVEVMKLQEHFNAPFSLRFIMEEEGWYQSH
ncbi:hypothetical protein ACPV5O_18065 [Vibrio maritimus]|uniref:hypothetical protein n=1 Tax=Vibrio maritimus TaxID=990268 RepID=UPI004068ED33